MYRVTTTGAVPTGTFNLQFQVPLDLKLVVFDMVMSPGAPAITVSVSANGIEYQAAQQVSQNAYRVNVWLPASSVK